MVPCPTSCPSGSYGSRRAPRLVGALVAPVAANAGPLTPATSFSPRSALNLAIESFPQQNVLPVWPDNPNDASANVGDIPYDEIAPKLNALQAASNRVSALGGAASPASGYDLYAVVVTAPETPAQYAQQEAWKQWLEDNPRPRAHRSRAARGLQDADVRQRQHPRQREGRRRRHHASVLEQWATSTDPAVEKLLQRNRHHLQRHVQPGRPRRQHARQRRRATTSTAT